MVDGGYKGVQLPESNYQVQGVQLPGGIVFWLDDLDTLNK